MTPGRHSGSNTQSYFRWLVPATVVIPLLVLLLAALMNRTEVIRAAEGSLQRDLDAVREHALKVFETQELLLSDLAADVAARSRQGLDWDDLTADRDFQLSLAMRVDRYDHVDGLALMDENGVLRMATLLFPAPPIQVLDRDYWQAARQGTVAYLSGSHASKLTGRAQFSYALRLQAPSGQFNGVAMAWLEPGYLQSFWGTVVEHPDTTVGLLRNDGAVLARWPEGAQPFAGAANPFAGTSTTGASSTGEAAVGNLLRTVGTADGTEYLTATSALTPFPALIRMDRRMADVLAPWRRNVLIYSSVAGPATLILLMLSLMAARTARRERQAMQSLRLEADRRAETARALRESEARYRGYFEHSPQCHWVLTVGRDGFRYEALNSATLETLGLELSRAVGRLVQEVLPPSVARAVLPRYEECRRLGEPLLYEETLDLPAGTRTFETMLVPLRDERGAVNVILGSARDVTERRQAEQRLVQAQKMETVGLLTGGVAHDFNNLLTAVINNLEMVRERPADPANMGRLDQALKAATAGGSLVRRLLAFARRQPLEPHATDINLLLEEAGTLIRRAVGERVEVHLDRAQDLPPVLVDPVQLENALLNLAVNARDAMPTGGRLLISTRLEAEGQQGRERVVLSVEDTGTGMPPEVAARVFEPFFTTKPAGQGTGLGLSTVYGFVEQSGGEMRLRTQPGKGTCFELAFPAKRGLQVVAAASETAEQPVALTRAATVLLVEDEVLVRLSTAALLREMGLKVLEAGSAEQALDLLDQHAGAEDGGIDLLVTDIGLPGMDGRTLAERVARSWPKMPVVMLTGYDRTANGPRNGGPEPANRYHLDKPYKPRRLRQILAEALAGDRAA